jgi:hypothetical protein
VAIWPGACQSEGGDGAWSCRNDNPLPSGPQELDCAARRSELLFRQGLTSNRAGFVRTLDRWTGDHQIPELQKGSRGYDPDTYCYAGKEHPELEGENELLVTYVCNTLKSQKLVKELGIYFPRIVRMNMSIRTAGQKYPRLATAGY